MKKILAGALFAVLSLTACGGAAPSAGEVPQPAKQEPATIQLGNPQTKNLQPKLQTVHPKLAQDKSVRSVRNACKSIQEETDEATLLRKTAKRFASETGRVVTKEQASEILKLVRGSGLCAEAAG